MHVSRTYPNAFVPTPVIIGGDVVGLDLGSSELFPGILDEVTLYNRALFVEEIAAIFNTGNAGKCRAVEEGLGGTLTGLRPARIAHRNLTNSQRVVIRD